MEPYTVTIVGTEMFEEFEVFKASVTPVVDA